LRRALRVKRYCGSASVQTTGGCSGVFQPQDEAESSIPDSDLKKRRSVRTTSGGKRQERYAVIAEVRENGGKPLQLFKFVNKETFDGL
jgi:hypothetical protein